jgi:hypothetical protein
VRRPFGFRRGTRQEQCEAALSPHTFAGRFSGKDLSAGEKVVEYFPQVDQCGNNEVSRACNSNLLPRDPQLKPLVGPVPIGLQRKTNCESTKANQQHHQLKTQPPTTPAERLDRVHRDKNL